MKDLSRCFALILFIMCSSIVKGNVQHMQQSGLTFPSYATFFNTGCCRRKLTWRSSLCEMEASVGVLQHLMVAVIISDACLFRG